MFELLVSDSPEFRIGDSTLRITFHSEGGAFRFRHQSFSGHDDSKVCSEQEAVETFWLFVRMKFGVLRGGPAA